MQQIIIGFDKSGKQHHAIVERVQERMKRVGQTVKKIRYGLPETNHAMLQQLKPRTLTKVISFINIKTWTVWGHHATKDKFLVRVKRKCKTVSCQTNSEFPLTDLWHAILSLDYHTLMGLRLAVLQLVLVVLIGGLLCSYVC